MEPLPLESVFLLGFLIHFLVSIFRISEYGVPDRREMYPYLMCPTREEIDLKESVFLIYNSLIDKFRLSEFWVYGIRCCHFFPVIGITPDE